MRRHAFTATTLLTTALLFWGLSRYESVQELDAPLPDELTLRTLAGDTLGPEALAGKPWVINLWLPGCAPCDRELPALERVRERFEPRGVGFLVVSVAPEPGYVRREASRIGLTREPLVTEGDVMGALGLQKVPSTLFVTAAGRIVALAEGERSERFFAEQAEALLAR